MARILLKGGCVLSLGAKTPNFAEADVMIEDGRIAEVAPGLRARDAESVDAADTVVMPGFVDTHRHAWKTLLRNLGEETSAGRPQPAAADYGRHYQPDDVYAATLLCLLSAVESGITTVVDWADVPIGEPFAEAALQAHVDAGLRTVLVHPDPRGVPADRLGPLTTTALGARDVTAAELDGAAPEWSSARELGVRIHAHAREAGLIAAMAERELLRGDVTLVHCAGATAADLDAIASHGASVSLVTSNDMATGLGPPPLQPLIDRGIRPGLGVDDELVTPGDVFTQMRAVQSLQHATMFELKLAGKAGVPSLLSTRDVIRYGTVDGAAAVGLGEVTGSLEPGKQADVVMLRTDRPNIHPVNDPIGAVVWGMDPSNVDSVFVAGRPLLRAGVLDADVARARELAIAARRRVAAAAGDLIETGPGSAP